MGKGLDFMEKNLIKRKTEELLEQFDFRDGIDTYVDITRLARQLGFTVGESSRLDYLCDGFMCVSEDKTQRVIGVNNDRSFEEKRFIVAHELAHYCLHYKDTEPGTAIMHREHRKGKNDIENDADYFAACILMPEKSFLQKFKELYSQNYSQKRIVGILQTIFRTPTESIKRRIAEVVK